MWYNCALLPLTSLEASTHARSWRIQKQRLPLRAVASLFPNSSAAFSFPICLSCGCLDFVRSLVFITFEPFEALHFGPICTTSISRCQKKCAFLQELLRCLSLSCTFQSTHRAFCRASKSKRCSDTAKKKKLVEPSSSNVTARSPLSALFLSPSSSGLHLFINTLGCSVCYRKGCQDL